MYRNVMVPVDGSPFSREAVLQGLRIASRSGATLRLVRVGTSSVLGAAPDSFGAESQALRQIQAAELSDLYSIAAECRAHSTVTVTASIQHGPVADALIGYARRQNVDLIVMRSHTRKGFARAWFGSVADALIRESGIPVLVVKAPSVSTALESGFCFNRILVPLDGSLLAEQSLDAAVAMARIDGATITLLKVLSPSRVRSSNQLESAVGPAAAKEVASAQRYLESCLAGERGISVQRRVVIAEDVPHAILVMAENTESDLIAIATHGRGAIARATVGSVADRVVRQAPISTMVVHPMLRISKLEQDAIHLIATPA